MRITPRLGIERGGLVASGTVLDGRYVLEELLDSGGMGDVWRATDRVLGRRVAVKVMRERLHAPDAVTRFEREARIAGQLQHPGITVVFDTGSQDGKPFIVMEFLDGQDLAKVLAQCHEGLPVGEAVSLVVQAADALQVAHERGVVHRDLKPGNLFVQRSGALKLCDFGIAWAAGLTAGLTLPGTALGTARYMAPEQWSGLRADARSDLYSLGCVFYELLTGQPPFTGDSLTAIMGEHMNVPPVPPRERRASIPLELDRLVVSMLAKDPADRPQSAAQVSAILRDIAPAVSVTATAPHQNDAFSPPAAEAAAEPERPETEEAGDRATRVPYRSRRKVGINLGTTKCVAAVQEFGEPAVVVNAEGSLSTPSVVAFTPDGEVLVGEAAERYEASSADRVVRSVMRHMGTGWSVSLGGRTLTAEQVAAFILKKLALDAEARIGEPVTHAVISVPACYGQAQRQAVREAAQIAGLDVERLVSEPSLAAKEYLRSNPGWEGTVLVFGLGGGSLSIAVAEIGPFDDGTGFVDILAVGGDARLGGDDWDQRIVDWLLGKLSKRQRLDLSGDATAMEKVRRAAEQAKIVLSGASEADIRLPGIGHARRRQPADLEVRLGQAEFQDMTADLLDRCRTSLLQVIGDSGVTPGDISRVLLIGAATRMPTVTALLTDVLGQEPAAGVTPDECVAVGASMNLWEILLIERYPHSLGIETDGPYGDSEIPALCGAFNHPPAGPVCQYTPLLSKNFSFPIKHSLIVTTEDDNQPSVLIQVYEGEREIAAYNRKLGMLELTCLAPAPRGIPQIEVTFEMSYDQVLEVSAKELPTGAGRASWSISKDALLLRDSMIKKATAELREYEESYRKKRELDEVKAIATKLIDDAGRLLSENEHVLSASVKSVVSSSIAALRDALETADSEEIRFRNEKLLRFAQDMVNEIYAASTAATRDQHEP